MAVGSNLGFSSQVLQCMDNIAMSGDLALHIQLLKHHYVPAKRQPIGDIMYSLILYAPFFLPNFLMVRYQPVSRNGDRALLGPG